MVLLGTALVMVGVVDALRHSEAWWGSRRAQVTWVVAQFAVLPVLFASIIGVPLAVVVVGAYFVMAARRVRVA